MFKTQIKYIIDMDVADIASLPALKRHSAGFLRFISRLGHRFVKDKCIQRASALAYASLLAIVPLVVLGFSVFTSFQAFDTISGHVRNALLEYLIPTSQAVVQSYLGNIADKAGALSIFGIIGLLITATALLNTMEEAFNDIWRISRKRALLSKFITFWSLLTLSPILLGASISITSYFVALPIIQNVAVGTSAIWQIPFLLPWLISSGAMTALYMALPNTSVPIRHALIGGMIAGALFELSKFGFTFYVTELANYEKIYGALGTLPVFLIWLYLVWVVVLIGAEATFCLQHPEQSQRHEKWLLRSGVRNFFAHFILLRAAQAIQEGRSLHLSELTEETNVADNVLQEWLDHLSDKGLLKQVVSNDCRGAWVLGIDATSLTFKKIHDVLQPEAMEVPPTWQESSLGSTLNGLYFRMQREHDSYLSSISVQNLLEKELNLGIVNK
ncbi:MAG: YihY family inner membrane protein [Mariprofundaceae bacterium]|nr:YihY family inner membrane protein [Mariprofundaceae bacterium]